MTGSLFEKYIALKTISYTFYYLDIWPVLYYAISQKTLQKMEGWEILMYSGLRKKKAAVQPVLAACHRARSYSSKAKSGRRLNAGVGVSVWPNACRSLRLDRKRERS